MQIFYLLSLKVFRNQLYICKVILFNGLLSIKKARLLIILILRKHLLNANNKSEFNFNDLKFDLLKLSDSRMSF
jgi:hypothetical protein